MSFGHMLAAGIELQRYGLGSPGRHRLGLGMAVAVGQVQNTVTDECGPARVIHDREDGGKVGLRKIRCDHSVKYRKAKNRQILFHRLGLERSHQPGLAILVKRPVGHHAIAAPSAGGPSGLLRRGDPDDTLVRCRGKATGPRI